VDDSTWKIRGRDCPAGTQVKVAGVDGVVLLISIES
jgi:membrane protein implicated in regulation of membrane protease activity